VVVVSVSITCKSWCYRDITLHRPKGTLDLNRTTFITLVVGLETSNQYFIPENLEFE